MKRTVKEAIDGTEITFLMPENEDDIKELERLEAQGILDARESFGDKSTVRKTRGGRRSQPRHAALAKKARTGS